MRGASCFVICGILMCFLRRIRAGLPGQHKADRESVQGSFRIQNWKYGITRKLRVSDKNHRCMSCLNGMRKK